MVVKTAPNSKLRSKITYSYSAIVGTGPTFRLALLTSVILALIWLGFTNFETGIIGRYFPLFRTDLPIAEVKIGIGSQFLGVYPNSKDNFYDLMFNQHLFDGLTKVIGGELVPALAASWTNSDDVTWVFKLKTDLNFAPDDAFTAKDVVFSIETAKKLNWPGKSNLETISQVRAIDDYTIEIITSFPDPILINKLASIFIFSKKVYEDSGKVLGIGPYSLTKLTQTDATLKANTNYYFGQPKAQQITFVFFPNDSLGVQRIAALEKKQLDLISGIDLSKDKKSLEAKGFLLKEITKPEVVYLSFDVSKNKTPYVNLSANPFGKKEVRQAIYHAINVAQIVQGSSVPTKIATQFVTAQIPGYNPEINRLGYDPILAKELIDTAGYTKGFRVTLDTPIKLKEAGEAIARQLGVINIEVKVNLIDDDRVLAKLGRGESSFFLSLYSPKVGDGQEILTAVLHSKVGTKGLANYANYSNLEIDLLEDQVTKSFDKQLRSKLLQDAFKLASADIVWVPLYSKVEYFAFDNSLVWSPQAFGEIFAYDISRKGFSFEKN